ncbi:DUF4082 domain-containing protein [Dactylosporangium salmoneum]|uniref:DUF4082 domain-containing protein n=1 Tax=Dactylosporangium salmoneum TaxID=53361 RepID=A0ABN3FDF4_9ACTN
MTVLGRHNRPLADSPALDMPYNALPGVDEDAFVRPNIPVWACTSDLAATASGVAIGTRIYLRKGDVVTNISFVSGNTAENTPTHRAHALYDPDGNLLAQTADQLTAAWAANSALKLALTAPVTIQKDGWYIVATTTTATTAVNSLVGAAPIVTATAVVHTGSKALGFTFGSALGGTFPATTGAQTGVAKCPLAIVS